MSKKIINLAIISLLVMFPLKLSAVEGNSAIEILDIQAQTNSDKTTTIIWLTDIPTRGKVIFGEESGDLPYFIIDNSGANKRHEVVITTPKAETTYYYKIIAYTDTEQLETFLYKIKTPKFGETIPPQIDQADMPYVACTLAVLEWKTDTPGSSRIEYDNTQTYMKKAGSDNKTTDHRVILKNLQPGATYYLRFYSVDKNGNKSSLHYKQFTTLSSGQSDTEDPTISYLRPNSSSDPYISATQMFVVFKTNHYAKGKVVLKQRGKKDRTQTLDYGLTHSVVFTDLSPETEYTINISLTDVFNKKITLENLTVKTPAQGAVTAAAVSGNDNVTVAGWEGSVCSAEILNLTGYYGQYYNLSKNVARNRPTGAIAEETGWYDEKYLSLTRVDETIDFPSKFFPLDEGLPGDPYYFAVHWQAVISVPADGYYKYQIRSDDLAWVFVDNKLISDKNGAHYKDKDLLTAELTAGLHLLDIYYVEFFPRGSYISFLPDSGVAVHPRIGGCSDISGLIGSSGHTTVNYGEGRSSDNNENVQVLGVAYSRYTPATALYKTPDSPDVYAIVNGQRHYISSPASFDEYGYRWEDVKTVSREELLEYPRARLLKSPDDPYIYYLYQRPEDQWLKISIPSPTAFISYPQNYWGNVITVTQLDIASYPDAELIKAAGQPDIYLLENNTKRLISDDVFRRMNFSRPEIVEVSPVHLETYKTGPPVE